MTIENCPRCGGTHFGSHVCPFGRTPSPAISFAGLAQSAAWTPPDETVEKIKERKYQCFIEDHEPRPWTPGQCAGYAGRGLHLMRCKRRDGHGLGGLFCSQHAKTGGY